MSDNNSADTFNNFRATNLVTGESKQFNIQYHAVGRAVSWIIAGQQAGVESRKNAEAPWETTDKDKSELERRLKLEQAARAEKGAKAPTVRKTQDPMRMLSNAAATLSGRANVTAAERDGFLELVAAACLQVGIDQRAHAGKK